MCDGRRTAGQRDPHVVGPGKKRVLVRGASDERPRLRWPRRTRIRVRGRAARQIGETTLLLARVARPAQPFVVSQRSGSPAVKSGPTGSSAASRAAALLTAGRSGATQACRAASGAKLTTSMPREPDVVDRKSPAAERTARWRRAAPVEVRVVRVRPLGRARVRDVSRSYAPVLALSESSSWQRPEGRWG